jgi:hypothetical protein
MSDLSDAVQQLLDRCRFCVCDAQAPVGRRLLSLHTTAEAARALRGKLGSRDGIVVLARTTLDAPHLSELDQVLAVARDELSTSNHTPESLAQLDTVTIHELGVHLQASTENRPDMTVAIKRETARQIYVALVVRAQLGHGTSGHLRSMAEHACNAAALGIDIIDTTFPI